MQVGPFQAVVPIVTGQSRVKAVNDYMLDPIDPFPIRLEVGDIWT